MARRANIVKQKFESLQLPLSHTRKEYMKSAEESIDRWFDFVEEYNKESSVPLSYVLLPNSIGTSLRTPGSPIGAFKLTKTEYNKIMGERNAARR